MNLKVQTIRFLGIALGVYIFPILGFAGTQTHVQLVTLENYELEAELANPKQLEYLETLMITKLNTKESSYAYFILSNIYLKKFLAEPAESQLIKTAFDLAEQAIDQNPRSEKGYVALMQALETVGQSNRIDEVMMEMSQNHVACLWRCEFFKIQSQTDISENDFEHVMNSVPTTDKALAFEMILPHYISFLTSPGSQTPPLVKLVTLSSHYPHHLIDTAVASLYVRNGQFSEAKSLFLKVFDHNHENADAGINAAVLEYRVFDHNEAALKILKKIFAVEALPGETKTLAEIHLGIVYYRLGNIKEGMKYIKSALKSSQEFETHLKFIVQEIRPKKAQIALELLREFQIERPGIDLTYGLAAKILSDDLGLFAEAQESYTNALTLDVNKSDYFLGRGFSFLKQKQFGAAKEDLLKATELDPENFEGYYNLACTFVGLGELEAAEKYLQQSLALNGDLIQTAKKDKDLTELFQKKEILTH